MSVTYHFTQDLSITTTGFGNAVKVSVGIPKPVPSEVGGKVVDFDKHPYIAKDGYAYGDSSEYPEQAVQSCSASLVKHVDGSTSSEYSKTYSSPSFWGIVGEPSEFVFEVGYDTTVECSWALTRVVFAYIDVEIDGSVSRMENVACTQLSESSAMLHMWGQTDSWGSEGETFLSIPWQEER